MTTKFTHLQEITCDSWEDEWIEYDLLMPSLP